MTEDWQLHWNLQAVIFYQNCVFEVKTNKLFSVAIKNKKKTNRYFTVKTFMYNLYVSMYIHIFIHLCTYSMNFIKTLPLFKMAVYNAIIDNTENQSKTNAIA